MAFNAVAPCVTAAIVRPEATVPMRALRPLNSANQKRARNSEFGPVFPNDLAEAVRFELTGPCEPPVFKTGAIDHSATLPNAIASAILVGG